MTNPDNTYALTVTLSMAYDASRWMLWKILLLKRIFPALSWVIPHLGWLSFKNDTADGVWDQK